MNFKKLRKIYRILFPRVLNEEKLFLNSLNSNYKIKEYIKEEAIFKIKLQNDQNIFFRDYNHSDYDVFKQIFNFEEYKLILSIINNNYTITSDELIFIDAGANVGYTTMYFSFYFNFNKIICIEPSKDNVQILEKNIKTLKNRNNIKIHQNALTNNKNTNFNLNSSFRDHKDWSITTNENEFGDIKGITLSEIIEQHNLKKITFLKIDIEGAERFIFNKKGDVSYLKIVKILAIEIHDEFNIREEINDILIDNNFMIFESGELTIGINKGLL